MKKAPVLIFLGLITLSADSTLNRSTSDTPVGQADAEDPKTGTDGNTNPL